MKLMKSGYTPWREETRIVWKKRIGYLLYQAAALLFSQEKLIQSYEDTIRAIAAGDTVYEQSALPIAYYFPREWCEHLAEYPFEGEAFPGPKDYDGFLGTLYGEYMVLPPVGKRENRHQIMELDFGE